MKLKCIEDLTNHFLKTSKEQLDIQPELCPDSMEGELTINCFRLARPLKMKPDAIADQVLDFLNAHTDIEKSEKVKAFVNFNIEPKALYRDTLCDIKNLMNESKLDNSSKKKYLIEYSAPNTNKPLHLGHLRNNTLGMSLVSLLRRVDNDVAAVNLVNDRGIHICKSMVGYARFGNNATPESTGKKGDHFVGDFYVLYDKELKRQIAELKKEKPELADESDEELFTKTEIGEKTQATLRKWENSDPETIALWKEMNKWVIDGFNKTYTRMGIAFDKVYFESDTYKLGKDIIEEGLTKGTLKKREDGAVIAPLKKYKLNDKVVLRADGTSVYITQDIGTTLKKHNDFKPDSQIWVVGDEQIYHFKTLFCILKELGYDWGDNLHHLAYGMINLPSGKMKSREGTVVDADNLFDEMMELAKNATLERCGDDIPADINERSEIIAQGALKFMLLKFNPKTTVTFDPQASIKFEGDTGPYVQYACARINSIIKKAEDKGLKLDDNTNIDWGLLNTPWEKNLAIQASFYPQVLLTAAEKLDCSGIILYLLKLAKAYNSFYRECPVLIAETDELKLARLKISSAIREIIADGLHTLTIDIPEAM
jgi:arginyl-tRNA synthetase